MHHWRQESFDQLESLQDRLSGISELEYYVEYLDLLERGLRKPALTKIALLITTLNSLPAIKQRELASRLCWETRTESGHKLIPHTLKTGFIEPVINHWLKSEKAAAEPRRWTGKLEDLVLAVRLDDSCEITRLRLIRKILEFVEYSTHELPYGYIGEPSEDLELLYLAHSELSKVTSEQQKASLLKRVECELGEIQQYLKLKEGK